MTDANLLKMLRWCVYRYRYSQEWEDCAQEAALEILSRPDRPWRRAGENGARRVIHNERRHHRRRTDADLSLMASDATQDTLGLDLEAMLAVVHARAARMLWRHHAEGEENEAVSREEGLAPHSAYNLCCRARARIRAAFPHY